MQAAKITVISKAVLARQTMQLPNLDSRKTLLLLRLPPA
jgi:hypothetical protein